MSILPHTIQGNGVPLVFIHAFPFSRLMWETQQAKLSRHYKFISFDLPGFGEAPVEGDVLTMETAAGKIVDSLDALGIKQPVVLTGLSMGGYVALQFARLFPERLRGIGLVSTRTAPDTPAAREGRQKAIDLVEKVGAGALADTMVPKLLGPSSATKDKELSTRVREWIQSQNPKGITAALKGMRERPDSSDTLKNLNTPIWICAGEEDQIVPAAEMKAMAESAKKADFTLIPGAGHLLNLEKGAEFDEGFEKFLKRRLL